MASIAQDVNISDVQREKNNSTVQTFLLRRIKVDIRMFWEYFMGFSCVLGSGNSSTTYGAFQKYSHPLKLFTFRQIITTNFYKFCVDFLY